MCVVNIYLSFASHYFTDKKCPFIAQDWHVTPNVLNNKCFFKAFLALLFIIRLKRLLTHLSDYKVFCSVEN